jgi:hypothetical protein
MPSQAVSLHRHLQAGLEIRSATEIASKHAESHLRSNVPLEWALSGAALVAGTVDQPPDDDLPRD